MYGVASVCSAEGLKGSLKVGGLLKLRIRVSASMYRGRGNADLYKVSRRNVWEIRITVPTVGHGHVKS